MKHPVTVEPGPSPLFGPAAPHVYDDRLPAPLLAVFRNWDDALTYAHRYAAANPGPDPYTVDAYKLATRGGQGRELRRLNRDMGRRVRTGYYADISDALGIL